MGKKVEPLTESYFYILLCLANGPNLSLIHIRW